MKKILAVLVLAAGALHAQVSNPSIIQPPSSPAGNSCTNQLPLQVYQGVLYSCQSGVVTALGGSGTVTSVAMTMPGVLYNSSVTGSPITSSGTLTPALINQTAYSVFGNFTGSSATPAFSTTPIFGSSTFNAAGAASTPALSVTGAWYNRPAMRCHRSTSIAAERQHLLFLLNLLRSGGQRMFFDGAVCRLPEWNRELRDFQFHHHR